MLLATLALSVQITSQITVQASAAELEQARYEDCLALVSADAEEALEDSQTWRLQGGGWPAAHCEARALIALGENRAGAVRLELIAERLSPEEAPARRRLLGEAGQIWLALEEADNARRAFDAALDDGASDALLQLGQAQASHALQDWPALEAQASALIALNPDLPDGFAYRAEARLEQGELDAAEADLADALRLAPERIELFVLRGRLIEARRLQAG